VKLSVVSTLFKSASHLEEFHQRMSECAKRHSGNDYEIILVNDGSPDNSLTTAIELAKNDPHVVVIDLSRNFGHPRAILAGLQHTKGSRVFLIDCDLEEEPEWLSKFSREMDDRHCDVVFGYQEKRKGRLFERFSGWLFYKLFNFFSGFQVPENAVTARLMNRRYVDALLLHNEYEISIGGLFLITGFDQHPFAIVKHDSSESTYSFRLKLSVMVDAVTSFSSAPLVYIFYVGLIISILSGISVAYLIFAKLFFDTPLTGWTSLMASIWLLGGLIVMFIGIVGIYLSKVYSESKRRPVSIIRQIYSNHESTQ